MKKKFAILAIATAIGLTSALPAQAATDPNAYTDAYIGYSQYYSGKIRGKGYALTSNSNMKQINVYNYFYQSGSLKEQGGSSAYSTNTEAAWYTKDGVYASSGSYSLNTASRTYYKDGTSSDQSYASDTW
jgi:hypothetical protein